MNTTMYQNSGIPNAGFGIHSTAQLDLAFSAGSNGAPGRSMSPSFRRRQSMRARAQWWFDQMRRVVDSAVEWKPAPSARLEQTAFDLRRETEVLVTK